MNLITEFIYLVSETKEIKFWQNAVTLRYTMEFTRLEVVKMRIGWLKETLAWSGFDPN